jgi:signal transduction histidine kinase/ActR/RegA family two-component response regulator
VSTNDRSDVILVVAPIGRDAELMCAQLTAAGLNCKSCNDIDDLCLKMDVGVGAVVATEEALPADRLHLLTRKLNEQPPWSEIPLVILTAAPSLEQKVRSFDMFARRTNVTLVDRPVRIKSLISAAQSALRARQRQYEVRDLMRQLEDRIHERDRFLAVLGHELRNPLGAILLAAQMTDHEGKLDGEHAQLIERQSRHLTRLVNDLLDLSRVAAGKIVLKRNVVDLREIAAQSIEVVKPAAERQNITLEVRRCEKPLLADADSVRVDQIVTNILTNAIKYTPEGGHVKVDLRAEDGDAVIEVSDDGVGIAADRIGKIFELFAQAENAIGRAQGGMGIGLALVRNLVELHGGAVRAHSDGVGKGSSFTVRLPRLHEDHTPVSLEPQPSVVIDVAQAASRRIVIVEDNQDVRDLLRLRLKKLGHEVLDAQDGVEGLRVVLTEKPDLALVDLGLPGIDGFEVAKGVRAELGGDVILVAVSGFGQPEDKRRALEAGFDEHITKPADVKDIEGILKRFPPRNSVAAPGV